MKKYTLEAFFIKIHGQYKLTLKLQYQKLNYHDLVYNLPWVLNIFLNLPTKNL